MTYITDEKTNKALVKLTNNSPFEDKKETSFAKSEQGGTPKQTLSSRSIQGRKNRKVGSEFERKVRAELEKDYIVAKWTNNVDLEKKKLVSAKPKFNPFTKSLMMNSSGFPDFLCYFHVDGAYYAVFGVECKSGRCLDKEEKEKCQWLIDNKIFSQILIATKDKGGKIIYKPWNS